MPAGRGYANGGFVSARDVPTPPDLGAYGDMVGYAGDKVDRYAYDKMVAYLNGGGGQRATSGGPPGSRPSGRVSDWVAQGIAVAGYPGTWVTPEVNIAMFESGGDPNAINLWDSNAAAGTPSKGLMQVIDPTFRAYAVAGYDDIWNPVHNVAAATNYIASRYGDPWNTPGERSLAHGGPYKGYSLGGLVDALEGIHVGIADRGGWLEPGWNLVGNGLGVREPIGATAGWGGPASAGGGDIYIQVDVHVHGPNLGSTKTQIAEAIADPLRAIFARRGQSASGNYLSRSG